MTRITVAAILALSAAGCAPAPRSAAYFEAHRDEAANVVAACASGAQRGQECDNARVAAERAARAERMSGYRQGF